MSSLIVEVCTIEKIEAITGKDRIVLAQVKGWNCIVLKDAYQIGDPCVFFPPDSIIPPPLIEKYSLEYLKGNGKVGILKMGGVISQGLVLSMDCLDESSKFGGWRIGDNVADILGITKWEAPVAGHGSGQTNPITKKKLNPLFDKYTDIEDIKNYPSVFIDGDIVSVTEKLHGCSFRASTLPIVIDKVQPLLMRLRLLWKKYVLKDTHTFIYGSHNVQINPGTKTYYGEDKWGQICKMYDLKNKIPKDYIVYGEMYGNVQDLTYGVKGIALAVFDIKYKNKYLPWHTVRALCKWWDLPTVPELYVGKYYDGILADYTNGKSIICPTQIREGCIIKDFDESFHPRVGRKILKSVSVDYLLRKNGTEFK